MATVRVPQPRSLPIPSFGFGRPNWWVVSSLLMLVIGGAVPVIQNSIATSRGFDVHRLQDEQAAIRQEIALLESDVARMTSLDRVHDRAIELGLGPAGDPIYVGIDVPGPEPARVPYEYLPRPVPETDEPEPWWQSLLSWLPLG